MSLLARSPMRSSSYYRAKDTITLRRIQMLRIKRFGSLSDSRLLKSLHTEFFSHQKEDRWLLLCRELPSVSSFNHHCHGLASTDAERGYPLPLAEIVHGINQRS